MLAHEVGALEVHIEHAVPLVGPELVHGPTAGHARGVDDDVEMAVLCDQRSDRGRDCLFIADVDRVNSILYVETDGNRAFRGEPAHARLADAGGRAGDERDPPVEPTHAVCSLKRVLEVKDGP